MPLDIIIGAQWGDEGKGRITDLLAAESDLVARFSGGDNAGHTVSVGAQQFQLHLVPSGIIQPHTICLLGNGMVINPATLLAEIDHLNRLGIDVSPARLKLSPAAHIITPAHRELDGVKDLLRGDQQLGTTRRGIGPSYMDKAARSGVRTELMHDPDAFEAAILASMEASARVLELLYEHSCPDPVETAKEYRSYAERLRPYLANTGAILHDALVENRQVLAEGAQGTLLDLDHGTYPYVTSSYPTTAGALLGLGVGPGHIRSIIGVAKSFQTRVGEGPFPTELSGDAAVRLRGTGDNPWDEFGTTTGRPRRCGWLDAVLLRYAVHLNGFTELAITKMDILTGLKPLLICSAYDRDGDTYEDLPVSAAALGQVKPVYEEQPGWDESIWGAHFWGDLPPAAQAYINRIEALTGLKVNLISVGPERDQVIRRRNLG